jgi:4-hydroxybenzoyl-CoA thioesterase
MARIEINLPDKWLFTTSIPIRIGDINRASHLSHVALVAILEEARAQFLVSLGYADQVNIQKGKGLILGDVGIVYKSQAHYGQNLKVEIAAADLKEKSFDLVYKLSESEHNTEIARAKTGQMVFDYQLQKVVPVPEEFKKKVSQ